jgi:uncharacterized RDD family membrane protein YckC
MAFLLDSFLQALLLIVLGFGLRLMLGAGAVDFGEGWVAASWMLGAFLLRTFYFIAFELRWSGRTPGKRTLGLRVVAADGGGLEAGMVFARNLTRELEVFLPLLALMAPQILLPEGTWWAWPAVAAWAVAVSLLPFFNRRRARLGDLAAGTVVVEEPRETLLPDLLGSPQPSAGGSAAAEARPVSRRFSEAQLEVYGIRELQVLEDVLRRPDAADDHELLELIRRRIERKIDWESVEEVPTFEFLHSFYAEQRAHLEHRMLLGERREKKRS